MLVRQYRATGKPQTRRECKSVSQVIACLNSAPQTAFYLRPCLGPLEHAADSQSEEAMLLGEIAAKLGSLDLQCQEKPNQFSRTKRKLELWAVVDSGRCLARKAFDALCPEIDYPPQRLDKRCAFRAMFEGEVAQVREYAENYRDILNSYLDLRLEPSVYLAHFFENASRMVSRKTELALQMHAGLLSAEMRRFVVDVHNDKLAFLLLHLLADLVPTCFLPDQSLRVVLGTPVVERVLGFAPFDGAYLKAADFNAAGLRKALEQFVRLQTALHQVRERGCKRACTEALRAILAMQQGAMDLRRFFVAVFEHLAKLEDQGEFLEHFERQGLLESVLRLGSK